MTLIPGGTLELYFWRPVGWLRHWCFVLFYGFFMALAILYVLVWSCKKSLLLMLSAFLITLGPLSSGCGFLTFKQPYSVSFFVTRGGVPASGVVIMSIINCVEPSYEPGEEVARLLP